MTRRTDGYTGKGWREHLALGLYRQTFRRFMMVKSNNMSCTYEGIFQIKKKGSIDIGRSLFMF